MRANVFLFTTKSTAPESDFFTIYPGHVAILTAHGIPGGTHEGIIEGDPDMPYSIMVERASVPPNSGAVDYVKPTPSGVLIMPKENLRLVSEAITTCAWTMDSCNNVAAITVPGVYRLRLSDASMLGSVAVDMMPLSIKDAALIPDNIKLGNY